MTTSGTLYVVATPIGNRLDITTRARNILKSVDVIVCEDTRRTQNLLNLLNIKHPENRLESLHVANEEDATRRAIDTILRGADVAIVSDAGTPVLSDPGFPLIRQAYEEDVNIVPVPGPSALTALISISPIPLNRFQFVGFLPRATEGKRERLKALLQAQVAVIFFESPVRIVDTLATFIELDASERLVFVGRELTKRYEEKLFGDIATVHKRLSDRDAIKGELVVLLAPSTASNEFYEVNRLIEILIKEDIAPTKISKIVAKLTGKNRHDIYHQVITVGKDYD